VRLQLCNNHAEVLAWEFVQKEQFSITSQMNHHIMWVGWQKRCKNVSRIRLTGLILEQTFASKIWEHIFGLSLHKWWPYQEKVSYSQGPQARQQYELCIEATTKSAIHVPQKTDLFKFNHSYTINILNNIFTDSSYISALHAITSMNSSFNALNTFIFLLAIHKIFTLNWSPFKSREMKTNGRTL